MGPAISHLFCDYTALPGKRDVSDAIKGTNQPTLKRIAQVGLT